MEKREERLILWGLSYGAVIGAHFVAMQPHRIKRMVLDGVVDTLDYMLRKRLHWKLLDTESIIARQSRNCYFAGRNRWPSAEVGGAREIAQRIQSSIVSLKDDPLGVTGIGSGDSVEGILAPDLITYSDVLSATFNALCAPIKSIPTLAAHLFDLSNGNSASFAARKQRQFRPSFETPQKSDTSPLETRNCEHDQTCFTQRFFSGDTRTAIICTDVNSTSGITPAAFAEYISDLRKQSPLFADLFAQVRMKCIDWRLRPTWRFDGPFSADTAFPLLLVGTTADPVTPIQK